jgi:hypothetical protein
VLAPAVLWANVKYGAEVARKRIYEQHHSYAALAIAARAQVDALSGSTAAP